MIKGSERVGPYGERGHSLENPFYIEYAKVQALLFYSTTSLSFQKKKRNWQMLFHCYLNFPLLNYLKSDVKLYFLG